MKIKSAVLLSAFILFQSSMTFAQRSEGGTPASFDQLSKSTSTIAAYTDTTTINVKHLLYEDGITEKNGSPLRIATLVPANIDIEKNGTWETLRNGQRIWRISIQLPNAVGVILSYDKLYIPEGGKLFVYDNTKTQLLGAYTHRTNPKAKAFSNAAIMGDQLVIEYDAPANSSENPQLKISKLGYMYNPDLGERLKSLSDACMVDINCPAGDNWQTQKRGVVQMQMKFSDGWYVCSGSLVNNTKNDGTPYVLSASHCFSTGTELAEMATTQYTFNYENKTCGDPRSTDSGQTLVGADLKVLIPIQDGSDASLVRLVDSIPRSWQPYYNGWDRSDVPATSGVVIHHPNGDVKKITTYDTPLVSVGNINVDGDITAPDAHWQVVYSDASTQGGSSGSPIFNQAGLIVGTLTGGSSSCSTPSDPDVYGKFWYHWDQYSDVSQRLKNYLDPTNTGVMTLEGYDPASIPDSTVVDHVIVFPSPFTDQLNVNAPSIIRSIIVANMQGEMVYKLDNYNASTILINTMAWGGGVYAIKINTDSGISKMKVIKR